MRNVGSGGAPGGVDVIGDVEGYYSTDPGGSLYTATTSTRILDTRNGTGSPKQPVAAGTPLNVVIAGMNGIPANVTAINITDTNATSNGYLTIYPNGQPQPATSDLDFTAGLTISNLVIVPVYNGKITIANAAGTVDVIGDLQGYYVD